jgi:hypothetical protein
MDMSLGGPQSRSGRRGENVCPIPGLELRPLGRPARSQSLYRLRYPGSPQVRKIKIKYGHIVADNDDDDDDNDDDTAN